MGDRVTGAPTLNNIRTEDHDMPTPIPGQEQQQQAEREQREQLQRQQEQQQEQQGGGEESGGGDDPEEKSGGELFIEKVGPAVQGDLAQFSPTIIMAILAAVAQLIGNCPFVNASSVRKRAVNRMLLVSAMKQSEALSEMSRAELRTVADKIIEAANDSGDEEIESFIKECKEEE